MELTLALDAGTVPVGGTDAKAPGTDPNDAASVAFASLLASLVAATAPTPEPTASAGPDAATTTDVAPIAAEVAVAMAVPTLAFDAPIALPAAPTPERAPEQDAEAEVVQIAEDPAELAPSTFALPEPGARVAAAPAGDADTDSDLDAEIDVEAGPTATSTRRPADAVRPTAVQLPEAVAPVAAPLLRSSEVVVESEPATAAADPLVAVSQPAAQAPAAPAREILKPEIVSGPGAARPASPVEQVVKAVAPLRRLADGTHNVVLELHPAELGAVRVELSLDRGIVHLGLRAEIEGTGQLLRAALPELRSQLDAAGLTSGRVSVDAGQAGPRGEGQPAWRTDPDRDRRRPLADDAELVEELVPTAYSSADYGHVDVRL